MGRLKGACGKPFRPASKTTVFEVPCSFGTAVLDECIRRQSQRFLSSTRLRHGICIAVFGVQKAPAPARAGAGLYKKWKGPVWRSALSPPSKVENEGRRRRKKCKPVRGRYGMWPAARRAICAALGEMNGGMKQKQYTAPGVSNAFFGFFFLFFPLTARFFRPIMLIMYHHGLVCPCAKNMPKIFVHFDDFCPGRKAALRGVTKKRNMLKK